MTEVVAQPSPQPEPPAAPEHEQKVTALELFFDLVFVFAITQVTGYVSADPDAKHLIEGLAILTALWWAWGCYAWLGNTAGTDEGLFRVTLLAAMAAMLIAAIAVPRAFGADALAFGIAYCIVRVLHLVAYAQLARAGATTRVLVVHLSQSMLPPAVLLVVAGLVHDELRYACWALALTIDVGGLYLAGLEGWRVEPAHLAERYGLIIIIALGESIVALGVGAEGQALDAGLLCGVLLGITVAAALWWAYFDVVVFVAERRFRRATGLDQILIARDSYTYLHLPMVAGIILFALGAKKTLAHVGDPLGTVAAIGLCGGVALYLLAHVAFRLRNVRRLNVARLVASVALIAIGIPLATAVPALLSLALVATVCVVLLVYEGVRYHDLRERLRHGVPA